MFQRVFLYIFIHFFHKVQFVASAYGIPLSLVLMFIDIKLTVCCLFTVKLLWGRGLGNFDRGPFTKFCLGPLEVYERHCQGILSYNDTAQNFHSAWFNDFKPCFKTHLNYGVKHCTEGQDFPSLFFTLSRILMGRPLKSN